MYHFIFFFYVILDLCICYIYRKKLNGRGLSMKYQRLWACWWVAVLRLLVNYENEMFNGTENGGFESQTGQCEVAVLVNIVTWMEPVPRGGCSGRMASKQLKDGGA